VTYATFHVFIIAKFGGIDNSPNNVYNKYMTQLDKIHWLVFFNYLLSLGIIVMLLAK